MPFDAFEKNYVTGDLFTRAGRQKAKTLKLTTKKEINFRHLSTRSLLITTMKNLTVHFS